MEKLGKEKETLLKAWAAEQAKLKETQDPKAIEEINATKKQLFQKLSDNLKEIAKLPPEDRDALFKKYSPANPVFQAAP